MVDPNLTPFAQLVQVMQLLRAPGGCPWDREQTHQSLARFLQEEACETLEAIDSGDDQKMCEELGDLLLQVVFHAQIAAEEGRFSIDDVASGIVAKMVRRHPHVFGDEDLPDSGAVKQRWEAIKMAEKGGRRKSLMEGLPPALSALLTAKRIQGRAAEVGFRWPDPASALAKVREELAELEAAENLEERREELGDLLFALVSLADQYELEAEASLRGTCAKFVTRFQALEARLGERLGQAGSDELAAAWEAVRC